MHVGVVYWSLLTYISFSQLLRNNRVRCNILGFSPTRQLFSNHASTKSQCRSVSKFRTVNPFVQKLFNANFLTRNFFSAKYSQTTVLHAFSRQNNYTAPNKLPCIQVPGEVTRRFGKPAFRTLVLKGRCTRMASAWIQ